MAPPMMAFPLLPLSSLIAAASLLFTGLFAHAPGPAPRLDGDALELLPPPPPPSAHAPELSFSLRQIFHHGAGLYPDLHRRQDILPHHSHRLFLAAEDGHPPQQLPPLRAKGRPQTIRRLLDRRPSTVDPMIARARQGLQAALVPPSAWTEDEVLSPDVTDRNTIISMAYMAANAYIQTEDQYNWVDVGKPFNRSADFGWQADGLRGHIWADDANATVVIGLKGTTPAVFDGDGTTTNDKINDNLFFSCCCAQQGPWTWRQACDCATDTYSCNNTCVVEALRDESRYYAAARELYSNVTALYPGSVIWLTGHSLGGSVSSLLGLTYGHPAVTFEAVPEALAASRLGLPVPPASDPEAPQSWDKTGIFHFGHTADPVFIGTCNGATASCSFAGYALETACHTGRECVWDVVADKGWRVGIGTHKIQAVIRDVILQYDTVPDCIATPECRDCALWKMYESNGTERTTTSASSWTSTTTASTSRTRTRTATCQTPGWWGCLDKTTDQPGSSSQFSSSSTSTCETPGWFWCKDKTTQVLTTTTTMTTTTTTTTMTTTTRELDSHGPPLTSTTTTCKTPGWFWCLDETTTTKAWTLPATEGTLSTTTTCRSPGWFWGCWDEAAAQMATPPTAQPGTAASARPPLVATAAVEGTRQKAGREMEFKPDEM